MELILLAILLTVTDESQLKGPENTVSAVGSNVALKCLSPSGNCSGIDWMKYSHDSIRMNASGRTREASRGRYSINSEHIRDHNPMTVFKDSLGIYVAFRGRYSIDNSSSGCDLIIENVTLSDAGLYICRAFISSQQTEKNASLVILSSEPNCTIDAIENQTVEGDMVQWTCEAEGASLLWKGVVDVPVAVKYGQIARLSRSVVASANGIPSYTCEISVAFEAEFEERIATNIPVVNCTTPAIKILYSVRNVTLSPSLPGYSPGTRINCTAKGNPTPLVQWQEFDNEYYTWVDIQNHTSDVLAVSNVTTNKFRCLATNVVRGRTYTVISHLVHINHTGHLGTEFSIDCLGAGLGIGLISAVIVLASVTCIILIRHRNPVSHPSPANKSLDDAMQQNQQEMMHSSTQRTTDPLAVAGEHESIYSTLGEDRDHRGADNYATLERGQSERQAKGEVRTLVDNVRTETAVC